MPDTWFDKADVICRRIANQTENKARRICFETEIEPNQNYTFAVQARFLN